MAGGEAGVGGLFGFKGGGVTGWGGDVPRTMFQKRPFVPVFLERLDCVLMRARGKKVPFVPARER